MAFDVLDLLIRAFPFMFTIIIANHLHYKTLKVATAQARKPRQEGGQERLILSYDLTASLPMRRIRYWIKLLRYSFTLAYLLLAYPVLPEVWDFWQLGWLSPITFLVGLFSSIATIAFHENPDESMRTLWDPRKDFRSVPAGAFFDGLRLVGSALAVPLEEELVFRSMLYRVVIAVHSNRFSSFTAVPFNIWDWEGAILTNLFFGWLHGGEWLSAGLSGLLFQILAARTNNFASALAAHGFANFGIGIWVLVTDQREYW